MTDLPAAIAAAREALERVEHECSRTDDDAYLVECARAAARLKDLLAALDAAQGEAVVEFMGRRLTPEKTSECWGVLLCDFMQDPPKGTKLYLAPQAQPAAVPAGYAAAIKAVQEMMPPRDFRPSAQVWLTGNQVNELHARLDAAAMLAAAPQPQAEPVGAAVPDSHRVRLERMRREFSLTTFERARFWADECRMIVEALLAMAQQQPRPQASAEDVALVEAALMRGYRHDEEVDAWMRVRASLGVGK